MNRTLPITGAAGGAVGLPAPTNLAIPPHRPAGDTRILIGGDAAA